MSNSLQDQLLKSGLVSKKQANQVRQEKRKQVKQQRTRKGGAPDEARLQTQRAQAQKRQRDRELNEQRQRAVQEQSAAARVRQLVESNRVDRGEGDKPFQFVDGTLVRKLYVKAAQRQDLSRGVLAVVRLDDSYELVPAATALRIGETDPALVVVLNTSAKQRDEASGEEDPYAGFEVPDDLEW